MRHALFALAAALLVAIPMTATSHGEPRPDDHAPIGVMADHTHKKGETMFSYRYMRMSMEGNRNGTNRISDGSVLDAGFAVTPTEMDMEMHMLGAMYAPSDLLTIMLMIPYIRLEMDHILGVGTMKSQFTTRSQGIGDIRATTMWKLFHGERHRAHLNMGVSFPTGTTDATDDNAMGTLINLPYPMQLGSGSFEFLPGITYGAVFEQASLGAQASGVVRLNENGEGYTKGDEYNLTGWGAWIWNPAVSTSVRLDWRQTFNYEGDDSRLVPTMVPTADPDRRAMKRLDVGLGINFSAPSGPLKGARLALEVLIPAYQNLDGPQLETDWSVVTGVQYAF